jgi:hypothetical protein
MMGPGPVGRAAYNLMVLWNCRVQCANLLASQMVPDGLAWALKEIFELDSLRKD